MSPSSNVDSPEYQVLRSRGAFCAKTYSTGEVARLCHTSQGNVIREFDAHRIAGYLVPDSPFRRITYAGLRKLMAENNLGSPPSPENIFLALADATQHSGPLSRAEERVRVLLSRVLEGTSVFLTANSFVAGSLCSEVHPDTMIIEESRRWNAEQIADTLQEGQGGTIPVIVASGEVWPLLLKEIRRCSIHASDVFEEANWEELVQSRFLRNGPVPETSQSDSEWVDFL